MVTSPDNMDAVLLPAKRKSMVAVELIPGG